MGDAGDGAWQERAYFTMHSPDGRVLDVGVGRHPGAGVTGSYSAYACVSNGERQINVRAAGPLQEPTGVPAADPFSIELEEPNARWRLRLDNDPLISFDIVFEARSAAWILPRAEIAGKGGKSVANTRVIFQSGRYRGHIELEGERIEVDGWSGARDRSWGYRKHEGRLPSGLLAAAFLELDDRALILWSVERKTGEPVLQLGARLTEDGSIAAIDDWSLDLDVRPELGEFRGAQLQVRDKSVAEDFTLTPTSTLYLAGGGYLEKGRHGEAMAEPTVYADIWDIGDPDLRRLITGLDDHGVQIEGAALGTGVLELQHGRHERYFPEGWQEADEKPPAPGSCQVRIGRGEAVSFPQGGSVEGRLVVARELPEVLELLSTIDNPASETILWISTPIVTLVAPVMERLKGVICPSGGATSHVAIVARELGMACVTQLHVEDIDALSGRRLRLRRDGSVWLYTEAS
jgi:phosphohistidine swiveling domain-containing protein